MTATLAQYAGRKIDLATYRGLSDRRQPVLVQRLVTEEDGGQVVTGIHKLVQRFLLILFTRRGSMQYLPESGCTFITEAAAGYWRTVVDVEQSFYASLLDVRRQLVALEETGDPDDERFAGANLTGVTIKSNQVHLAFAVHSAAGSSYEFIQPISVLPR